LNAAKARGPLKSFGLFHSEVEKETTPMMNITAKPTWQWSSKNPLTRSVSTRASNTGPVFKQLLLPRSLDVEFSLKYRR
jgi:hypothetical protein